MKRGWKIAFSVGGWSLIAAFFIFAAILRHDYEADMTVERLEVVVADADRIGFVTPEIIVDYIVGAGLNPVGQRPEAELLAAINAAVERYNFVAESKTYADYEGTVTVELTQRRPMLRVGANNGRNFYLTEERFVLPVEHGEAVRLPVVTGKFELPFPRNFSGDLDAYVRENEKKSDKSYIFICKLVKFVDWLQRDKYWRDKIVQIVVTEPKHSGGSDSFPELVLVPREGDYTIDMGVIDGYADKLARFRVYQSKGLASDGQRITVKYRGQVVSRTEQNKQKNKNK